MRGYCKDCECWFQTEIGPGESEGRGACHLGPPHGHPGEPTRFPLTLASDWCWQFEAKPQLRDGRNGDP
jgi:hypothetical protein